MDDYQIVTRKDGVVYQKRRKVKHQVQVSTKINEELYREFCEYAKKTGLSKAKLFDKCINYYIKTKDFED